MTWLRRNLFTSPWHALLSLAVVYGVYLATGPIVSWVFLDATWTGSSYAECGGEGACWAFIIRRFGQFMYGFYPDGQRWRVDMVYVILGLGVGALIIRRVPGKRWVGAFMVLAFPFVAYAATDDIMLAGGTPLFGGLDERIVYFAPKVRLYSDGVTDVAVGGLFFEELGNSFSGAKAGALFGVLTRGSPDQAVTLGVAIGYDDDGFLDQPVVMLGGEFRLSRTIKLVTENYFVPDVTLLAIGPRFFGERLSADLGLAFAIEHGDDFFTLPLVNFVYVW